MVVENVKTREQTTIVADEEDMTFGVFGFNRIYSKNRYI